MNNKAMLRLFIVATVFVFSQVNASHIELEGKDEQRKIVPSPSPLNPEFKEIMRDMLSLDEVYETTQASKKVAPNSDVIKFIEKNTVEYIEDLKRILPQVIVSKNDIERQELIDDIHRKNNPFETFYY